MNKEHRKVKKHIMLKGRGVVYEWVSVLKKNKRTTVLKKCVDHKLDIYNRCGCAVIFRNGSVKLYNQPGMAHSELIQRYYNSIGYKFDNNFFRRSSIKWKENDNEEDTCFVHTLKNHKSLIFVVEHDHNQTNESVCNLIKNMCREKGIFKAYIARMYSRNTQVLEWVGEVDYEYLRK